MDDAIKRDLELQRRLQAAARKVTDLAGRNDKEMMIALHELLTVARENAREHLIEAMKEAAL